jgi:hypothetical protein
MKKDAAMQRVRIGLTGLSCVFLLVLLAAAFLGFVSEPQADNQMVSANASNAAAVSADNAAEAPKEPLAELGVAPGNAPNNSQSR